MTHFLDKYFREPFRRLLMQALISTEKRTKTVGYRSSSIFQRDIRIPSSLIAILSAIAVFIMLVWHAGWTWQNGMSIGVFITMILGLLIFYLQYDFAEMVHDDEAMMLLGTLAVLFVGLMVLMQPWDLSFYITALPAASILATLLLHLRISLILSLILSLFLAWMHAFSMECFLIALTSGFAGATAALSIRSHRDFIRVGVWIAGMGLVSFGMIQILLRQTSWITLLGYGSYVVLNGLGSSMIALGVLPFLESFFQRITPMKLHELSDFNQPLLKRLMVEAPGTYHHSLMMATIVEAAALEIGANALLCRVGAYYHDIGKLVKPEYFIENQGNVGYNPHGHLAPALSSLVVIQHVKEGIALARAAKLPQEIINFIPMHHGTSCIEYFYHQAREEALEESLKSGTGMPETEVEEESYRYPGPKPHTKETAIVMMADSVEAAARTLEDPTHPKIKDLVERLVHKKLEDAQIENVPLTLREITKIKDAFVKTLTSIYHSRIEYPNDALLREKNS
jgi:putative nucleotidyltransferase with HDIG domain